MYKFEAAWSDDEPQPLEQFLEQNSVEIASWQALDRALRIWIKAGMEA